MAIAGARADRAPVLDMPDSTATLADLELWDMRVDGTMTGEFVDALFQESPLLPGIIVVEGERITALISRRAFYGMVDRSFSRQVYWRRPVSVMVESLQHPAPTVLPARLSVAAAVEAALARTHDEVFDPLVIDDGSSLHLLEIDVLLRAQTGVLAAANREKEWLLEELARLNAELYDARTRL